MAARGVEVAARELGSGPDTGDAEGARAFERALVRAASSGDGDGAWSALERRARSDPEGLGAVLGAALSDRASGGRGAALVERLARGEVAAPEVRIDGPPGGGALLPRGTAGAFEAGVGGAPGTVHLGPGVPGDPGEAALTLAEEMGHALDAALGPGDAPGDEGEVFARLALGRALSPGDLARLRAEDDRGVLRNGRMVEFRPEEGAGTGSGTPDPDSGDPRGRDQIPDVPSGGSGGVEGGSGTAPGGFPSGASDGPGHESDDDDDDRPSSGGSEPKSGGPASDGPSGGAGPALDPDAVEEAIDTAARAVGSALDQAREAARAVVQTVAEAAGVAGRVAAGDVAAIEVVAGAITAGAEFVRNAPSHVDDVVEGASAVVADWKDTRTEEEVRFDAREAWRERRNALSDLVEDSSKHGRDGPAEIADALMSEESAGLRRHLAKEAAQHWAQDADGIADAERAADLVADDPTASGELARGLGGTVARGEAVGGHADAFLEEAIGLDAHEATDAFTNNGGRLGAKLADQGLDERTEALDAIADGSLGGGDRRGAVNALMRDAPTSGEVNGRAVTGTRRGREEAYREALAEATAAAFLDDAPAAQVDAAARRIEAVLATPGGQRMLDEAKGMGWDDREALLETVATAPGFDAKAAERGLAHRTFRDGPLHEEHREARADDIRAQARGEALEQLVIEGLEDVAGTVQDVQAGTDFVLELDKLRRGAAKGELTPNEAERMARMEAELADQVEALERTVKDAPEIVREQIDLIDALGDRARATRQAYEAGLATGAKLKEAEREHAVAVASVGLVVKGAVDVVRNVLRGPEGGSRGTGGPQGTPDTILGGTQRRRAEVEADTEEMRGRVGGNSPSGKELDTLIEELVAKDVKLTPDDVVGARRIGDDRIAFLETGNRRSGLQHIRREHGDQFAAQGIPPDRLPDAILTAIEKGEVVGAQGTSGTRPIYEYEFEGEVRRMAVTMADNGYIVGANPTSMP